MMTRMEDVLPGSILAPVKAGDCWKDIEELAAIRLFLTGFAESVRCVGAIPKRKAISDMASL